MNERRFSFIKGLRSDFDSPYGEKGQKRSTRPKASGAAQLKRAATKRNNIRKHK